MQAYYEIETDIPKNHQLNLANVMKQKRLTLILRAITLHVLVV